MSVIPLAISDDLLPLLDRKARTAGVAREEYILNILVRDLHGPRSLDEILAGFRAEVAASGITDTELDDLFEQARNESASPR